MKRLLISGFVAVALLAVATTLRSHSIISADRSTVTTGDGGYRRNRQPPRASRGFRSRNFEDMSLVFSTPVKH